MNWLRRLFDDRPRIQVVQSVLTIAPGDVVVLSTQNVLSKQMADALRAQLTQVLPPGQRTLIVTESMKLSVLHPEPASQPQPGPVT